MFLKIPEGKLLLLNADTSAMQVAPLAGIKTENPVSGKVVWRIGEVEAGSKYVIPFVNDSLEDVGIELEIVEAGIGNGYFEFITYATDTNNMHYPPVMYASYFKNPDDIVNRFWSIEAKNYTVVPSATITFRYAESDTGA